MSTTLHRSGSRRSAGVAGADAVGRCRLRALVLLDAPRAIDAPNDSSMAIAEALSRRGHDVELGHMSGLALEDGAPVLATVPGRAAGRVDGFDVVLLRNDPPFDAEYLHATLLLEHVRDRCVLVNDPRALRDTHEKLFPLRFPDLVPPTIVTSQIPDLVRFRAKHGGAIVVKPLDGCGGEGVFVLREHDPNTAAILETATDHGRRRVIGQQYLPAARQGDKRILLLDGRPIGAFLRRPANGQARANLHAGGCAVPAQLDARDREICRRVGAHCRQEGLVLAGLDVIGGLMTELNVTSPAGFRSLERLYGVRAEEKLVDWIERAVEHKARRRLLETGAVVGSGPVAAGVVASQHPVGPVPAVA